jgi:hypothetical protein
MDHHNSDGGIEWTAVSSPPMTNTGPQSAPTRYSIAPPYGGSNFNSTFI